MGDLRFQPDYSAGAPLVCRKLIKGLKRYVDESVGSESHESTVVPGAFLSFNLASDIFVEPLEYSPHSAIPLHWDSPLI